MRKDAESLGQGLTEASLVWQVKEHELSRKLLYNFEFVYKLIFKKACVSKNYHLTLTYMMDWAGEQREIEAFSALEGK